MPILEQRCSDIERLTVKAPAPPPWERLLRLALEAGGGYWPDRALDWLEDGYPADALADLLEHVARTGATQRIRHRARRLAKGVRRQPNPHTNIP
ncbi:hypothetical protein [Amycolatopsis methanolica]|uniref:hypothetical protein n=1 Tax=Amycolatopsis methanolica TaxID=1814 RepID=UPI0034312A5B